MNTRCIAVACIAMLATQSAKAQNVGLGTSMPNGRLQFKNEIFNRMVVLNESGNNEHNFFGFGINEFTLRYQVADPAQSHVFFAGNAANASGSNELFRIRGNGNVGIGNSAPNAPLQFANDTRNRKIVLWSNQNNDHEFYGFGVNGGLLRYQTATTSDDHVFYSGTNSTTSRELMRIKGDGLVGIGANNPQYRLDVDNRIRVRSGGDNNNSAGIWLNRTDNTALQSFLGINQGNVGFYGVPFGWGLEMNTTTGNVGIGNSAPNAPLQFAADTRNRKIVLWQTTNNDHQFYGFGVNGFALRYQTGATTDDHVFFAGTGANTSNELFRIKGNGALGINGNTGQPGQVLRSNGNNAAASWMDSEFDRTILISGNGNTLTDGDGQIGGVVPGLSHTFTLAGNAKVLVQFNISARALPCAFCGNSYTWVDIRINGTRAGWFRNYIANDNTSMITGSQLLQLGAGTHTLTIFADASGPSVAFGGTGFTNNMIVQIIPQ